MFYCLKGKVVSHDKDSINLEVLDAICFKIYVTKSDTYKELELYNLFIHDFFRDEEYYLYGFDSVEELNAFRKLLTISGIGVKTAMQILRNVDYSNLFNLIRNKDVAGLKSISGIGNKAERLIYELKEKGTDNEIIEIQYKNVCDVLLKLGYKNKEVLIALSRIKKGLNDSEALVEAIRVIKDGSK